VTSNKQLFGWTINYDHWITGVQGMISTELTFEEHCIGDLERLSSAGTIQNFQKHIMHVCADKTEWMEDTLDISNDIP